MDLKLKNKKVVVTGSSRGLGLSMAKEFLSEGAQVMLCARSSKDLEEQLSELRKKHGNGLCYIAQADLSTDDGVDSLRKNIEEKFGELDILVCNIGSGKSKPILAETDSDWREMMDTNFYTAVKSIRSIYPLMADQENKEGNAAITVINTICSLESLGAPTTYSSSKSALLAHTKSITAPLAKKGIRVNTLTPGNILFPGSTWDIKLKENPSQVRHLLKKEVALQRFSTPEEVARVAVFLSSPVASFVCGSNWVVDGGQMRSY
jgi:3-oxoacyl-[acyl-carrier protein] reductase